MHAVIAKVLLLPERCGTYACCVALHYLSSYCYLKDAALSLLVITGPSPELMRALPAPRILPRYRSVSLVVLDQRSMSRCFGQLVSHQNCLVCLA